MKNGRDRGRVTKAVSLNICLRIGSLKDSLCTQMPATDALYTYPHNYVTGCDWRFPTEKSGIKMDIRNIHKT